MANETNSTNGEPPLTEAEEVKLTRAVIRGLRWAAIAKDNRGEGFKAPTEEELTALYACARHAFEGIPNEMVAKAVISDPDLLEWVMTVMDDAIGES